MAVVVFAFLGALLGLLVITGWVSFDLLSGYETLTHDRGLGVFLLGIVVAELIGFGLIAFEELLNLNRKSKSKHPPAAT
jgi:hypothetical protein